MSDTMGAMGTVDTGWVDPVIPDSAWEGTDDGADLDTPDLADDGLDTEGVDLSADDTPDAPAEPEAAAPEPAAAAKPADDEPPAAFLQRLQDENMQRRLANKPYEEAFQGYDDASRQAILDLAKDLVANPAQAAARMEAYAANIRAQAQFAPEDTPLTKADVDRLLAERDAQAQALQARQQEEQMASQVFTKLQGFGLEPQSYEAQSLILAAMLKHDNDLDKAHKAMLEEREAADKQAVQRWLDAKKAKASGPKPTTGSGATPGVSGNGIKTIDDAARAAMASWDVGF